MNLTLKALAVGLAAESAKLRREQNKLRSDARRGARLEGRLGAGNENIIRSSMVEAGYTPDQVDRAIKRWKKSAYRFQTLQVTRSYRIRAYARDVHVARAFLNGMPLGKVESPYTTRTRDGAFWNRVLALVTKNLGMFEPARLRREGDNRPWQMLYEDWKAKGNKL